jgi:hypothetical protein
MGESAGGGSVLHHILAFGSAGEAPVELDPDIKEHSPSDPNDALTAPPPVSL